MKHELKIVELKLSLKKNGGKNNFEIKAKNADLRSQLNKVTSKLESIKLEYAELEKFNTIVKRELMQTKQQLEKLYTNSEKIEELYKDLAMIRLDLDSSLVNQLRK